MDEEEIRRIIDGAYDESREDTLRLWFRDGYSKKMRWVMVCVYTQYVILSALIIFSAIKFFTTHELGYHIMYAAIFVCCSHWMGFISVFGWIMMQRPRMDREIKRLELRIVELTETVKSK